MIIYVLYISYVYIMFGGGAPLLTGKMGQADVYQELPPTFRVSARKLARRRAAMEAAEEKS
jgi:hypothetical protein